MARTTGQRGNPALLGKNIERRRDADEWNYKFQVAGQPYYGPCNTMDKRKAEKIAADLKASKKVSARRDVEAGLGPMKFGAACDFWWTDVGSNNVETGLKFRLDWLMTQIGANKLLKDITPDDITRAKNERAKCTRTAGKNAKGEQMYRTITPGAVRATMVTMQSVINYASKAKGAAIRMFDWTTWIKHDEEEYDIRVMTETEQKQIWEELDDDVRELAEFNLETPKRINEILPLEWPRVDLVGELIRIKLKGKVKLCDDPIGPPEVTRLQALKARKLHPKAVFTYVSDRTRKYNGVQHTKGERRPMTYEHFYKEWTAACARAGIDDLNPHCLRHTGATRFYWASAKTGVADIYTVSKMLNHSDISTTVKYYAKHDPEVVRDLKRRAAAGKKSFGKSFGKLRVVS